MLCFASCTGIRSIDKRKYNDGFYVQRDHSDNKNVSPVTDPRTVKTENAEQQPTNVTTQQHGILTTIIAEQKERISNSPIVKLNRKINAKQQSIATKASNAVMKPAMGNKDRTAGALFVIFILCSLFALLIYAGIVSVMRSSMNAFGKIFLLLLLWIVFGACALEAIIALILAIVKLAGGNND